MTGVKRIGTTREPEGFGHNPKVTKFSASASEAAAFLDGCARASPAVLSVTAALVHMPFQGKKVLKGLQR